MQNPSHVNAADARKLEALCGLRGTQGSGSAQEAAAMATAKAFRENSKFSPSDRLEVAVAMERRTMSARIKSNLVADQVGAWLQVADRLRGEFGDLPEVAAFYVEAARPYDVRSAAAIVAPVLKSKVAPVAVKNEAQGMVHRAALLGKPLKYQPTMVDGGRLEWSKPSIKYTTLVVWSPARSGDLALLKQLKGLPKGVQIAYLALGGANDEVARARKDIPFPGVYCHAAEGIAATTASESLRLNYAPLPQVYLIDAEGKVLDVARPGALPAAFAKLTNPKAQKQG